MLFNFVLFFLLKGVAIEKKARVVYELVSIVYVLTCNFALREVGVLCKNSACCFLENC